jgi:hypothetical protein
MDQKQSTEVPENNSQLAFDKEQFSLGQYDKHVRQARYAIYAIAVMQVVMGAIIYATSSYITDDQLIVFAVIGVIATVFVCIGLWSRKQPFSAIVTALTVYIGLIVLDAVQDPGTLTKGVIFKIIIIVFLVKGLRDAREAQRMSKMERILNPSE